MARHYRLLCPIARALDRLGDRWTLLILRDLHAGPARFTDLQLGLPGLAPNLLTTRLRELEEHGLVVRRDMPFDVIAYDLTELGQATAPLLFELAVLGSRFPPGEDLVRPGNLRTAAVTLKVALQRVTEPDLEAVAELRIDDEPFELRIQNGRVDVKYGPAVEPGVVLGFDYEPMVAAADGRLSMDKFAAKHAEIREGDKRLGKKLLTLMASAMVPPDQAG